MDEIEDDKYEAPVFTCPEWGHRLILRVTKLEAENKRLRVEMDVMKRAIGWSVERSTFATTIPHTQLTEEEAAVLENKE